MSVCDFGSSSLLDSKAGDTKISTLNSQVELLLKEKVGEEMNK